MREDLRLSERAGGLLDETILVRQGEVDHRAMLAVGPGQVRAPGPPPGRWRPIYSVGPVFQESDRS
jgi:hypothetical protein